MEAWYTNAVFYHIYPLGLAGAPKKNEGADPENRFDELEKWLYHMKELHCTALYIGPLFESVGHGYETTDYRTVDRRLGTNEDFRRFVKKAHELSIRVVVDGVFNHTGREFHAFRDIREKRERSEYRNWYCNVNFGGNNEYNDGFSYDNWGGYNLLAKLNLRNPAVKEYLYDTVRFWVSEFDIDGIRLDAADVLDFEFMKGLRDLADGMKEDFWLMGEVIHGDYSRWANGEMLHSVTNYELHKGLYSGHNDHNYFEIAHSVKRLLGLCRDALLYNFVDNHDVARVASKVKEPGFLYSIYILLYTLPGIPSIYYGSEFGIEGKKEKGSDDSLRPRLHLEELAEKKQDKLYRLLEKLGEVKGLYPELSEGEYRELLLTNRQYAFGRILGEHGVLVAVNNEEEAAAVTVPVPIKGTEGRDLFTGEMVKIRDGKWKAELEGFGGSILYL